MFGGSEGRFAQMMTQKARMMGMNRTTYRNASGLPDPDQVTTARDQATLGLAIQERFPRYYRYFATHSFTYRGSAMRNHNRLLGNVEGVDGIKTGYTRASGFNLVTSMRRGDRHVVAVVLGGTSGGARDARMRSLLETHIADAEPLKTTKIATTVPVTASEPVVAEAHVAKQAQSAPMLASSISTPKRPYASDAWLKPDTLIGFDRRSRAQNSRRSGIAPNGVAACAAPPASACATSSARPAPGPCRRG